MAELAPLNGGYYVVILGGLLARQATRLLLLYGEGVVPMMIMQATYAAATRSSC